MNKKSIPEIHYQASRICRALGNPTAYEVVCLLKKGKRSPEQLAVLLGVSLPTVSQVLRVLRDLDLVRYEVKWRKHEYWIKTKAVSNVLICLERLIKSMRAIK
jgi:DNA-binding transcriptional ArsR family regulator